MRFLLTLLVSTFIAGKVHAHQPLISVDWLQKQLQNNRIVILDLRNAIDKGGIEKFRQGHIPGSIHSDYLKAGWRVKKNNIPGLLPDPSGFEKLVKNIGISKDTHVILVPAGVSSTDFGSSARAYWQFKVYGHNKVSILDGGYEAWKKMMPHLVEKGNGKIPAKGNFKAAYSAKHYINTKNVARISKNGGAILLDGRNEEQWKGKSKHPAARAPGNIPRSKWQWQGDTYNTQSNRLKTEAELTQLFEDVMDQPIVSYCNTGHWAATNWFVLSEILGHKDVKLYDGSMTEWASNTNFPLTKGQTKFDDLKDWIERTLNKS
ncbi:MAG: sulfurtransferase [Pseudomonadota bacterium]|nr:sulfurtransferase [Pseudomonadota bacterium]